MKECEGEFEGEGEGKEEGEEEGEGEGEGEEEGDAVRLADADLREGARLAAERLGIDLRMDCTLHNLGAEADKAEEAAAAADEEAEVVAMRAMRPLRRGAEVFNTYGEHGERVLLSQYGFVLGSAHNAMDVAPLPWATLRAALDAALGAAAARRREHDLRAIGSWRRVLGRGAFAFDRLGRPPRRLLLAAWLLCADGAVHGAEAEAEAEADRFLALPLASQLAPSGVRVSPRAVLLEAVRAQARRLDEAAPTTTVHEAADEGAVRPQVARDAATLVEGQRAIWRAAEEQLGAGAEQEAATQRRGGTKRQREQK